MIRRTLWTQSRPHSRTSPRPLCQTSPRIAVNVRSIHAESDEEEYPSNPAIVQILSSVATRTIAPQTAVKHVMSLTAKDKTGKARTDICFDLWHLSMKESRKSKDSAVAMTDFLIHLSYQAQEEFDNPFKDRKEDTIMSKGDWGSGLARLWCDMPRMGGYIYESLHEDWPKVGEPDWRPRIDHYLQDMRFISLLFRSSQPSFGYLGGYLGRAFNEALGWPWYIDHHEYRKIWLPAIIMQMDTAGAKLKADLVNSPALGKGYFSVGDWRRWQRKLLKIAADETVDPELRAIAKRGHTMMDIEKRLSNLWWRRHRKELSEITANERNSLGVRAEAQIINKTLAAENAEEEASAIKMLPLSASPPLLQPPF